MGATVFPAPVTSSVNSSAITCASANTLYGANVNLATGIYTITCTSTTIAKVEFYSDNTTLITRATTASGTVAINLATAATKVRIWTDTGSNIVVTIALTANALSNNISGTLDTVTTVGSSTYTGTSTSGYGFFLLAGGGGQGGGNSGYQYTNGGGGGSGGYQYGIVALTGSMPVTIGAGGSGIDARMGAKAADGGSSTFAGYTAGGGGGGYGGGDGNDSGTKCDPGAAGIPNGVAGGGGNGGNPGGNGGAGGRNDSPYSFMTGSQYIGTSGGWNTGAAGTLSGGGGGSSGSGAGGAGGSGVLYVLKF